jgi:hypothetical protein
MGKPIIAKEKQMSSLMKLIKVLELLEPMIDALHDWLKARRKDDHVEP